MILKVKKFHPDAKLPVKAHPTDAGFDVFSDQAYELQPGTRKTLDLGIAVDIPEGYCLVMLPKSGLSVKNGLGVLANVIDQDYTGMIHAVLVNHGGDPLTIERGMKVAQVLIVPVPQVEIVEVADILKQTDRGAQGFGSSGSR